MYVVTHRGVEAYTHTEPTRTSTSSRAALGKTDPDCMRLWARGACTFLIVTRNGSPISIASSCQVLAHTAQPRAHVRARTRRNRHLIATMEREPSSLWCPQIVH